MPEEEPLWNQVFGRISISKSLGAILCHLFWRVCVKIEDFEVKGRFTII